jgi:hypothetical protein
MSRFPHRKDFEPSAGQELYAYLRARHGDDETQKALAALMHVTPPLISKWKALQGFNDWLTERVAYYRTDIHELLEQTARRKLAEDFRYWQAMALKYGFIKESEGGQDAPAAVPSPLNEEAWARVIKMAREG